MTSPRALLCTSCLRKSADVNASGEVVKYCIQCSENLCKPCLKEHIRYGSGSGTRHTFLNKDEMPPWLIWTDGAQGGSQKCSRHPDNDMDVYCPAHHVITCGACIVLEHDSCENVIDTTDDLDEEAAAKAKKNLQQLANDTVTEMSRLIDAKKKTQAKHRKNVADALMNVREFRQYVDTILDKLEKTTTDQINSFCIENDDKIEQQLRKLEKQALLLHFGTKNLKEASERDTSLQDMINVYYSRKVVDESKTLCQELRATSGDDARTFRIAPSIKQYFENLKSLGELVKIHTTTGVKTKLERQVLNYDSSSDDVGILAPTPMHSGKIYVSDSENKNVKVIDDSGSILNTISFQSIFEENIEPPKTSLLYEPHSICRVDEERILVSFEQDKLVGVVTLVNDTSRVSVIHVGEVCRGVCYNSLYDELYVCCGGGSLLDEGLGQLKVFKLTGDLLRTVKTAPPDKKPVFSRPVAVACSNDGSTVFVSDVHKGIVVLNRKGKQLSLFTARELDQPRGICVDVNDNLIVCGHGSNNIIKVSRNLDAYEVIVRESDGLSSPQCVCFVPCRSKLLITMSNSKELLYVTYL
ncbi:uncharacterized protein LOC127856115 [Dreissena polymorpha]|uniref:B box-type domain-containing protein n=1 Tax=Dreissena polymorpha TaxID=45954 RepID=A0A9D4C0S2_DREPO|nr:uncharacterized protein LOC127856115 [Dreissena polymorpha]KAH3715066.1 hypothetical protein DPMN_057770 [Dreissena polymorpha]